MVCDSVFSATPNAGKPKLLQRDQPDIAKLRRLILYRGMDMNDPFNTLPDWARPLLTALGLQKPTNPRQVLLAADDAATRLAPNTRRMWKWVLVLEGLAVLAPLLWLLVSRFRLPISFAACSVLVCTLLVVGICWWLRWRGMQFSWARTRMIAEIARSAEATGGIGGRATAAALGGAPGLQTIADWIAMATDEPVTLPDDAKKLYREMRIEDQLAHYQKKRREALEERTKLSRHVTRAMDGALFLAVTGVAISLNGDGERWLRLSGSDYILGCIGVMLPLIAILMQLLASFLELNRRSGRYVQQIEFLIVAKKLIDEAATVEEVRNVVKEVERVLLGEVVEWFYQAQHAEPYYRSKAAGIEAWEINKVMPDHQHTWARKILEGFGASAGFVGRVVFGRILVAALSMVVTTALIAFCIPKDSEELSRLRMEDGRLLSSPTSHSWEPDAARADKGFILIAHGLHDGVDFTGKHGEKEHWMTLMQETLNAHLGREMPDLCLVDWHLAAIPAAFSGDGLQAVKADAVGKSIPTLPQAWLQDVAAIRPQAEEIGDLVGYKLARAIRAGKIRRDRPMQLIGHSAGGFVVLHAAMVLKQLGLAPCNLRVTMLDTPMPVAADLLAVLDDIPVDYYCTSSFATGVPASGFYRNFTRFDIKPPATVDAYLGAHSYAYKWYIQSIAPEWKNGFGRSPFSEKH
jgi:hypothetical protein